MHVTCRTVDRLGFGNKKRPKAPALGFVSNNKPNFNYGSLCGGFSELRLQLTCGVAPTE